MKEGAVRHAVFTAMLKGYRRIFVRRRLYALNRLLFNLSLRGLGILNDESPQSRFTGEAAFLRAIARRWGPSPCVLDVGAHSGGYARMVRAVAPGARIFAFEPHPRTFPALASDAAAAGYTALNVACGAARGTADLWDYADADGSEHASLHRGVIDALHHGRPHAHEVSVVTIDDFVAEHGLSRIDLLKVDTEGHELEVLRGAKGVVDAGAVDVVHFEFNAMNVWSRTFLRDFWTMLPGFRFYRMLPDGLVALGPYSATLCEIFAYQNVVAIRDASGLAP